MPSSWQRAASPLRPRLDYSDCSSRIFFPGIDSLLANVTHQLRPEGPSAACVCSDVQPGCSPLTTIVSRGACSLIRSMSIRFSALLPLGDTLQKKPAIWRPTCLEVTQESLGNILRVGVTRPPLVFELSRRWIDTNGENPRGVDPSEKWNGICAEIGSVQHSEPRIGGRNVGHHLSEKAGIVHVPSGTSNIDYTGKVWSLRLR